MPKPIQRITRSHNATFENRHRFEHWLVDNQIYFITARCRDRFPAFESEKAKEIFWDRFNHYTAEAGFVPKRQQEFWRDSKGREYFDGCIRDEKQARLAYRYTLTQGVRAGLVKEWSDYVHVKVNVELVRAVKRALELDAFLTGIRYKRYLENRRSAR